MDLRRGYEDDFAVASQYQLVSFMNKVYAWMMVGLMLTGMTSVGMAVFVPSLAIAANSSWMLVIIGGLGCLGLVFFLSTTAQSLPAPIAIGGFLLYSVLNGVFLSAIFFIYPIATISLAFFVGATLFGVMALFGTITKKDLSGVGSLCFIGLIVLVITMIGLAIASAVFGFDTKPFDFIIAIAGIVIFIGLTAWDAQKIKMMSMAGETSTGLAICGALALYLDFINLFLFLLRLFSSRD